MEGTGINNRIFYLAGGAGSRFGSNKLLHPVTVRGQSKPLYRHGFDRMAEIIRTEASYELYVISCHTQICREMEALAGERIHAVYSPHSPFGISHTIRAGLEAAGAGGENVYDTFLVADMPWFRTDELADFMERTMKSGRIAGCVTQAGRCKNPVMFRACLEPELLALTGDVGGKAVFLRYAQDAFFYECGGCLRDIDRPEDLSDKLYLH